MQNRYVGDIGDYVKLAILRALSPGRDLGVAWWLFPDESHNADGGHREYLDRPNEWGGFDPFLFEALRKIAAKKERRVSDIEKASILPNAVFASPPVPCEARPYSQRPGERWSWFDGVKMKLRDCDLVFIDPDNGVAPPGLKLTCRRAGKSVMIEEIKALQRSNRAMVVYHHQTRYRGGHVREIPDVARRLSEDGLRVSGALRAKPRSPRAFFILNGDSDLQTRAENLAGRWVNWISWHPM